MRTVRAPGLIGRFHERRAVVGAAFLMAVSLALAIFAYRPMLALGEIAFGEGGAPLYAILGVAPAVVLTAAGLLARRTHPESLIGVLLIAEGLLWDVGPFAYSASYVPAASELSALTGYVAYAVGGHILLSYPTGRLRGGIERVLTASLYLWFGPAVILAFAFHSAYGPGCPVCLDNAFQITPNDTLDIAANATYWAVAAVLIALTAVVSIPRWRQATPLGRRSLAPVYLTRWGLTASIAVWCALGVGVILPHSLLEWELRSQILVNPAAIAVAAGILVVFLRASASHGAAGRLALDLDRSPLPAAELEGCMRSALGDPDARLLFRDETGTAWVDSGGVAASPADGRSISLLGSSSGSALEHDPALDADPAVVQAVGAVAGLALDAERMRAMKRVNGNAGTPQANGVPALRGVLTPREREVLALVAEGLTDGAIAQRLYLTRRTVETHISHIFTKLGVPAGSSQNRRVHAVRRYLSAVAGHD